VTRTSQAADTKPLSLVQENAQRDMFAVACKKHITNRLDQWRCLREKKANIAKGLGKRLNFMTDFLGKFERELQEHIGEIIEIIDSQLIPHCKSIENKVFYYKMLADYHRHSTDFYEDDKQYMTNMSDALSHYK